MTKQPKSLQEMATEAATAGGIVCPKCNCADFRIYRSTKGVTARFQYKACRHCGHKILTTSQTIERIVRDVASHDADDDPEPLLFAIG
jgi:Zn ribbon nucleic-acid-binding protein